MRHIRPRALTTHLLPYLSLLCPWIHHLSQGYMRGKPIMSDEDYNTLRDKLRSGNSVVTAQVIYVCWGGDGGSTPVHM